MCSGAPRHPGLSGNLKLKQFLLYSHAFSHLFQSDVPIDLLDVDKNSAVVSYSACDPEV